MFRRLKQALFRYCTGMRAITCLNGRFTEHLNIAYLLIYTTIIDVVANSAYYYTKTTYWNTFGIERMHYINDWAEYIGP